MLEVQSEERGQRHFMSPLPPEMAATWQQKGFSTLSVAWANHVKARFYGGLPASNDFKRPDLVKHSYLVEVVSRLPGLMVFCQAPILRKGSDNNSS